MWPAIKILFMKKLSFKKGLRFGLFLIIKEHFNYFTFI